MKKPQKQKEKSRKAHKNPVTVRGWHSVLRLLAEALLTGLLRKWVTVTKEMDGVVVNLSRSVSLQALLWCKDYIALCSCNVCLSCVKANTSSHQHLFSLIVNVLKTNCLSLTPLIVQTLPFNSVLKKQRIKRVKTINVPRAVSTMAYTYTLGYTLHSV